MKAMFVLLSLAFAIGCNRAPVSQMPTAPSIIPHPQNAVSPVYPKLPVSTVTAAQPADQLVINVVVKPADVVVKPVVKPKPAAEPTFLVVCPQDISKPCERAKD